MRDQILSTCRGRGAEPRVSSCSPSKRQRAQKQRCSAPGGNCNLIKGQGRPGTLTKLWLLVGSDSRKHREATSRATATADASGSAVA